MSDRVRKGDVVAVVSGDDRGKRGRVLRVFRAEGRVIVEGVNLVYKHLRRSQKNPQGGRIRREAPIHASNVMPIDTETNRPTRIRVRMDGAKRVRVSVQSGTVLDASPKRAKKSGEDREASGKKGEE